MKLKLKHTRYNKILVDIFRFKYHKSYFALADADMHRVCDAKEDSDGEGESEITSYN